MLKTAIANNNYDIIKLLLEHGADMTKLEFNDLFQMVAYMENDIIPLFSNLDFSLLNSYTNKNDILSLLTKIIDPIILAYIICDIKKTYWDYLHKIEIKWKVYRPRKKNVILEKLVTMDTNEIINYFSNFDYGKQVELGKLLIEFGYFDVFMVLNFADFDNDWLLYAVKSKSVVSVSYFLDLGLDMYANDGIIIRELCWTNSNILELFIDRGLKIDYDDNCLFVLACENLNFSCIKILIDNNVDMYARNGQAIISLIENYDTLLKTEIFEYLINVGININYGSGIFLNAAIGKNAIFKLLLENGADIQYLDLENLVDVLRMKNIDIIQLLIDAGVDFSILNSYIASKETQECISLLMNNGLDINVIINIIYNEY